MKRKSLLDSLVVKFSLGNIRPADAKVMAGKESRDKVRQQFIELSRLGNNPIVMQMGN